MTEERKMSYEERAWLNKEPIEYAIYKGIRGDQGALRFKLKKAYTDRNKERAAGCVFLEMAPAIGKNNYDWENSKIIIALNPTDISKILLYLRSPNNERFAKDGSLKIIHDPGAGTPEAKKSFKGLTITKPKDQYSFWFNINHTTGSSVKKASVSVSPEEALLIGTLLQAAVPLILSWVEGQ